MRLRSLLRVTCTSRRANVGAKPHTHDWQDRDVARRKRLFVMHSALSVRQMRRQFCTLAFASVLASVLGLAQELSPTEIIQRSCEVNQKDWDAAADYDYFQLERDGEKSKTNHVMMLEGSRYSRLVAVDEKPLSPEDEAKEQQRYETEAAKRQRESVKEREERIGQYNKERDQGRAMMGELTKALDFTLSGKQDLGSHGVYVFKGTPRADYHPPNKQAKALSGMQGTLWVDAVNFHWVKAEAEVVRPVWIGGFVARVEPGTRFELEQVPVADGLWMPSHFSMAAKATIFFLFPHREKSNESYFGYHKSGTKLANVTPIK